MICLVGVLFWSGLGGICFCFLCCSASLQTVLVYSKLGQLLWWEHHPLTSGLSCFCWSGEWVYITRDSQGLTRLCKTHLEKSQAKLHLLASYPDSCMHTRSFISWMSVALSFLKINYFEFILDSAGKRLSASPSHPPTQESIFSSDKAWL